MKGKGWEGREGRIREGGEGRGGKGEWEGREKGRDVPLLTLSPGSASGNNFYMRINGAW